MRPNRATLALALLLAFTSAALAKTTWYADGVNGNDSNNCKSAQTACKTIGHAISLASSGDSIMVAAAIYGENLSIGFSLKIVGSGAATTIIDGGGVGTVVTIPNTGTHVTLSQLTIRNGFGRGGGVYDSGGTLTINNCTVSGNDSGGLYPVGGGIYNGGTLTINTSTISGNGAASLRLAEGGGIYNGGTLTINNSTVSGNKAHGDNFAEGGGIDNQGGKLKINNSTLGGNGILIDITLSGNGVVSGGGSGINNSGTATLQNSILANYAAGGNCSGTMISHGYNLSSDGSCSFNRTGDLNNSDPMLGPLQNNGGPTQTQALPSGSPAIDAGNPNGCTDGKGHLLKTDQRGEPRPDNEDTGGCDMGAYESNSD